MAGSADGNTKQHSPPPLNSLHCTASPGAACPPKRLPSWQGRPSAHPPPWRCPDQPPFNQPIWHPYWHTPSYAIDDAKRAQEEVEQALNGGAAFVDPSVANCGELSFHSLEGDTCCRVCGGRLKGTSSTECVVCAPSPPTAGNEQFCTTTSAAQAACSRTAGCLGTRAALCSQATPNPLVSPPPQPNPPLQATPSRTLWGWA